MWSLVEVLNSSSVFVNSFGGWIYMGCISVAACCGELYRCLLCDLFFCCISDAGLVKSSVSITPCFASALPLLVLYQCPCCCMISLMLVLSGAFSLLWCWCSDCECVFFFWCCSLVQLDTILGVKQCKLRVLWY